MLVFGLLEDDIIRTRHQLLGVEPHFVFFYTMQLHDTYLTIIYKIWSKMKTMSKTFPLVLYSSWPTRTFEIDLITTMHFQ